MKGLLWKDFYMIQKYCKAMLVPVIVFLAVSMVDDYSSNLLFLFYPVVLMGLVPVTILAYDEKCRWLTYGETFPYSREQLVSVKYLISLLLMCGAWLVSFVLQLIRVKLNLVALHEHILFMLVFVLAIGLLSSGILFPIVFKLGTEKGRFAYMSTIILICAGGFILTSLDDLKIVLPISANTLSVLIFMVSVVIFFLSWLLSIQIYKKRELI